MVAELTKALERQGLDMKVTALVSLFLSVPYVNVTIWFMPLIFF